MFIFLFNQTIYNIIMKQLIRKILKEESLKQENLKQTLKQSVKEDGWEFAADLVNGPEDLAKLAFNNDPMEFLNLFNDLNVVQSREEFYWSLFRYKKRNNLMIYNTKNNTLYISKKIFSSFLDEGFGLSYSKMEELMRIWLYDTYNLRGDRTFEMMQIFDWEKSSLSRIG
jgi:hypothetical protein